MTEKPCPNCQQLLEDGFVYFRGAGSSLHWSTDADVGALSRKGLTQIDLQRTVGGRNQATLPAVRCGDCGFIGFNAAWIDD